MNSTANKIIFCITRGFLLTFLWHSSVYSNSLTYPSLSDMLLLQCPQDGFTPLDLAEENSKEEAAGVLRRHGAKRGAELVEELRSFLFAAQEGMTDEVAARIAAGQDVNARDPVIFLVCLCMCVASLLV